MTEIQLAFAAAIAEVQKNRTEIKKGISKDNTLETSLNTTLQTLQALQTKVNQVVSGGTIIPHYATTQARDLAITQPTEGQVCYVGSSGNWLLYTYELNDQGALVWVEGHISNHETAADDVTWKTTKQDKLTVGQLAILGGTVFTQAEKDLLATLDQTYALKTDLMVDDTALKALQADTF